MKFEMKWMKVLGLALSLPSTILGLAWLAWYLVDAKILSSSVAYTIFFLVIGNTLFLIVRFSKQDKKEEDESEQKS